MISVIIPTYNCGQYIERAIESIFSQSISSNFYEVIVVDDGSTDNTLGILEKYDNRIKVIKQTHEGLVSALNRGIRGACGNYIMRLDADDYLDDKILWATMNILLAKPKYQFVYTDRYVIAENSKRKLRVNVHKDGIFNMIGCGILFNSRVFETIGYYRDLLFEEYDLMLRIYENKIKGYYLQQPLYCYIKHKDSMTAQSNYWEDGWKQLKDIWGNDILGKYSQRGNIWEK